MKNLIEDIVHDYDCRNVSRRDFVGQLTTLMAVGMSTNMELMNQNGETKSLFKAIEINHLAIKVTDLDRTQKFYEEVLGMSVIKRIPHILFMGCGTHFIAFMKKKEAGFDHFCLTLATYNQNEIIEKLKLRGISTETEEVRVYFHDPDGNLIQLAHDDYPASSGRPKLSSKLRKQIYEGKSDYITNAPK